MDLIAGLKAIANASGDDPVDWDAVATAAKSTTDPGSLSLSDADQKAYAKDVRDARAAIRDISALEFEVPPVIQVQNRHHWIEANIETFRLAFEPLEDESLTFPQVARTVNTATASGTLAYIARHVLGQYDPLLLAEGDPEHELYFVHPNVVTAAEKLDLDFPRFRRWIAFHEVSHAAEFGAAPWLADYLSDRLHEAIAELSRYDVPRDSFRELNVAMTAVEGYAELLMDHAFDAQYDDMREKLDRRRSGGDPATKFIRRLLGFQLKRRQYEQGRAFFDTIAGARGIDGAGIVWTSPDHLPTRDELTDPRRYLDRVE